MIITNFKKMILKITRYYFDDIININDLDLDSILPNGKSFENILIYDAAYNTPVKDFIYIIFDKVDGYITK